MRRPAATLGLLLALAPFDADLPARAAETAAASPAVLLPPMLVEESKNSVPWYYTNVGGTEFLSRCTPSITRSFIDAWLGQMQLMRTLVPEDLMMKLEAPALCILYAQSLDQAMSAEILHELEAAATDQGKPADPDRVNIAPNMRLGDRDTHATIVYIDEAKFDGSQLSFASSHVRYLLQGRVPELPAWLMEGIERLWRRADFKLEPISFPPLGWSTPGASDPVAVDLLRFRTLLPAAELFTPDWRRATENQHPRHVQSRIAQQELFVRWALTSGEAPRKALWKFAVRAAEAPVTEEMFEACFGFDFSELRDRLSDYLPIAADEFEWFDPGKPPRLPPYKIELATLNQIGRVRGEWERLAIWHVQRRLPQAREPYIAQARRTLRRTYAAGDRDPRLLATMGLCEIEAGHPEDAREFLEPATDAGVIRPSAYYELARLRLADLRREIPGNELLPFTRLSPVIRPLQRALTQAPPLADAVTLLAEAWTRCETAPTDAEWAELERGAQLFPRRPTVAYPVALVLNRHGKRAAAAAVLDACAGYATDEKTAAAIVRLRAELPPAPSPPTPSADR